MKRICYFFPPYSDSHHQKEASVFLTIRSYSPVRRYNHAKHSSFLIRLFLEHFYVHSKTEKTQVCHILPAPTQAQPPPLLIIHFFAWGCPVVPTASVGKTIFLHCILTWLFCQRADDYIYAGLFLELSSILFLCSLCTSANIIHS